jgi:SulP family sulfate permease
MYSRKTVIRETFSGTQLRSTVHRLYRQQNFLDKVGNQIHIIKLQGYMFFGTINQLDVYLKEISEKDSHIKFFVLDFTLISGVDYSGLETFLRIKRNLAKRKMHLIFCGLASLGHEIQLSGIFEDLDDGVEDGDSSVLVHSFNSLNDALEWAENYLLATYYIKSKIIGPKSIPTTSKSGAPRLSLLIPETPRSELIHKAADMIMQGLILVVKISHN